MTRAGRLGRPARSLAVLTVMAAMAAAVTVAACSSGDGGDTGFDLPTAETLGGPVLASPRVQPIYFKGFPYPTDIDTFVTRLSASTYWPTVVAEYGVGRSGRGAGIRDGRDRAPHRHRGKPAGPARGSADGRRRHAGRTTR